MTDASEWGHTVIGWFCSRCGTWVPSDEAHSCPSPFPGPNVPTPFVYFDPEQTELLREIRDLLKGIAGDVSSIKLKYVNNY